MRTQANLVKRGSVWYFRKKVLQDLRKHYGRESIRQSLNQHPALAEAKREATRLAVQFDAEFEAIRQRLKPTLARPLTAAMVPQIAKALIGHILTADEEIRAAGMGDVEFTQMEEETESTAAEVRRAYARGDSSPIDAALEDWLNGRGIDATPAPAEFQQLRREFLKARLKALDATLARNRGELVETLSAGARAQVVLTLLAD